MGKLDGKVAIVTGASRGIGKAIAIRFGAEGAKVVCTARTLHEGDHRFLEGSLETTVAEIKKAGGQATAIASNVSEWKECEQLVEQTKRAFGPVDILVNNAALNYYVPVVDYEPNRWARSFAVNINGPFYLSKLVLPDMIARRKGSIINISSGAARGPGRGPYPEAPIRGGTMYGASKAALERFTQGLAQEVWQHGISVAAFSPSELVPTEGTTFLGLTKSLDDAGERPDIMAQAAVLLATLPYDKISGRVTYSQAILKEFGWTKDGHGIGFGRPGSGYSEI
ncbi:MAG: SDR family NAD(P)-dependent oxidoreductase [Dehalococcoidia bacterium]|nr:SDR family NAD(P)-dependent oxidoreductase [Dehalococcoidia bacterium]